LSIEIWCTLTAREQEEVFMADYEERQAKWEKKEQAREKEERKGEVKVGEAVGKVTRDIGRFDDVNVRIDKVKTMSFQPAEDLRKGDSIGIVIEADWTTGRQEKRGEERKGKAKIGEAVGKVSGKIGKASNVRVRIDKVETMRFQPSADLKKGDSIRVTVDKL
jgi:hypothetical protein